MAESYVEFYIACNPLLVPRAVTEVITSARGRFEGILLEILYEPDAQWFKCISTTGSKNDISDYLQSKICRVHNEQPELIDHGSSTLTSVSEPQADLWDLISGVSETQKHFRDEDTYPAMFAHATYKATWDGFNSTCSPSIATVFGHLRNVFGPEPLAHLEAITSCTISSNLRQDNVYIKSKTDEMIGRQYVNFAKKTLDSLVNACELFQPSTSTCGSKIFHHEVIVAEDGSKGFSFKNLPKEHSVQSVAYILTNTSMPLLTLRSVQSNAKVQATNRPVPGAILADITPKRSVLFHHDFAPKQADTIGAGFSGQGPPLSNEEVWSGLKQKVKQWLSTDSDANNIGVPQTQNADSLSQNVFHREGSQDFETTAIPELLDLEPSEVKNDVIMTGQYPMQSNSMPHTPQFHDGERQNLAGIQTKKVNTTIEKAVSALNSMATIAILSPGDFTLSVSIGKCYFVDYYSTKPNEAFLLPSITRALALPGLPQDVHFHPILSTEVQDANTIIEAIPRVKGQPQSSSKMVQYEIRCKFHDGSEWTIEIDAETFEYRIRRNTQEYSNIYLHCPESVWDARMTASKCWSTKDEHVLYVAHMAVKSIAIRISQSGDPVLEMRDLGCFSAKTVAVRLKYTTRYYCRPNRQIVVSLSWYKRMKKKEGFIRYEPQESAGLTWLWNVAEAPGHGDGQLQQWLSASVTLVPLERLLSVAGETTMVAESMSELQKLGTSGLLYDLCSVTLDLVKQMDQVGSSSVCISKQQATEPNDIW